MYQACYDTFFELCAILMYSLPYHSIHYTKHIFPLLLPFLYPLIHICLTGSVYTTMAVAMERCVTVLVPFTQIKVVSLYLNTNAMPQGTKLLFPTC